MDFLKNTRNIKEKYEMLFEESPNYVIIYKQNGAIVDINNSTARMMGIEREILNTFNIFDFFNSSDAQNILNNLTMHKENEAIPSYETELITPHDDKKNILIKANMLSDGNFMAILTDITEQKKTERKLEESVAKLTNFNRVKTKELRNIIHDFRNPFSVIYGVNDALHDDLTKEDYNTYLNILGNALKNIKTLFDESSNYIEMTSSNLDVSIGQYKLGPLLEEIVNTQRILAKNKGLYMHLYIEDEKEYSLVDEGKYNRVMSNVIGNAIKYTDKGGIKIKLYTEKGKEYSVTSVSDTGIGIRHEDLENIFEPYYRSENAKSKRYEGHGLGLSFVKQYIEAMYGNITVDSKEDKGTEFKLMFKLASINE